MFIHIKSVFIRCTIGFYHSSEFEWTGLNPVCTFQATSLLRLSLQKSSSILLNWGLDLKTFMLLSINHFCVSFVLLENKSSSKLYSVRIRLSSKISHFTLYLYKPPRTCHLLIYNYFNQYFLFCVLPTISWDVTVPTPWPALVFEV